MRRLSVILVLVLVMLPAGSFAARPAQPKKIYLPTQTSQITPFYINGVPMGAVESDSAFIMVSLEFVELGSAGYMRLWLLYSNETNLPYLLEPLNSFTLAVTSAKQSCEGIVPESPTQISSRIDNERARRMILQVIGGALETLSTRPTTVTSPSGAVLRIDDTDEKIRRTQDRTEARLYNTATYYDVFKGSINAGILRRNTVFPGQSVNGYVYFPLQVSEGVMKCPLYEPVPGAWRKEVKFKRVKIDPIQYKFVLDIKAQHGTERVEFMPVEGE